VAKKKPELELPTAPLLDLAQWWSRSRVRGMVIGAVAVAFLGRPRTTRDVDGVVAIDEPRWERFLQTGLKAGFQPRIPDVLAFAATSRVFLLRHEKSAIDVDISCAGTAFELEALGRLTRIKLGRRQIPLPTAEDLIVFKAVAHRPRDLFDIEGIVQAHPDLDLAQIQRYLDHFAAELDEPGIFDDVHRLLASAKPKPLN
jgi:hypothetical protein